MNELDFTIEMNTEGIAKPLEDALFAVADKTLRNLADGHDDMIGAAVTLRQPGKTQNTFLYEATVVTYIKPENIAGTVKNQDPEFALREALDVVEKQIRKRRDKKGKPWEKPQQGPVDQEIVELLAAEQALDSELEE